MKGKKYLIALVILPIFLLSLATTSVHAAQYVKVYVVEGPEGYIPGVDPGKAVLVTIKIEVTGITDNSASGIVQWGIDVKVDPEVLELLSPGVAKGAAAGYFLYDFCYYYYYDPIFETWNYGPPQIFGKENTNPTTGYWDDLSEVIMPVPPGGAGSGYSGKPLTVLGFYSKSLTAYSKIELLDVMYMDATGTWHTADEVISGDYNPPPVPEFPLGSVAPIALIAAVAYIWWVTKRKTQGVT